MFGVRYSGRVVQLDSRWDYQAPVAAGGGRAEVYGFSKASRRRLLRKAAALRWVSGRPRVLVTLTYPREFSRSGREVKEHLAAFRKRLERRWGTVPAVWKMEFQRRGAAHFHLLMELPAGDLACFQSWVSNAWFLAVGSGDLAHLAAGTNVEMAWSNCLRYFSYAFKGESDSQNVVPDGFDSPGRYWGVWNSDADWRGTVLDRPAFARLRRLMRAWARSKGRYAGSESRLWGEWYVCDGPAEPLLRQMLRAVELLT